MYSLWHKLTHSLWQTYTVSIFHRDTSNQVEEGTKKYSIFRTTDTNTTQTRSVLEAEATGESSMSGFYIDLRVLSLRLPVNCMCGWLLGESNVMLPRKPFCRCRSIPTERPNMEDNPVCNLKKIMHVSISTSSFWKKNKIWLPIKTVICLPSYCVPCVYFGV